MSLEREGYTPPEVKKIFIPKDGEIFSALTKGIENLTKKEEKTPIEREDFLLRILEDRDYYQEKVNGINGAINKMFTCENIGVKLSFYELAKSGKYGFDIKRKPKAGFRKE